MRKLRQNFFYFNIPAVLKLFRLKNQITLNTILESGSRHGGLYSWYNQTIKIQYSMYIIVSILRTSGDWVRYGW